jgi:hypothetical protein
MAFDENYSGPKTVPVIRTKHHDLMTLAVNVEQVDLADWPVLSEDAVEPSSFNLDASRLSISPQPV